MAAIAPWFCLRLPSCGPRFESQAHNLSFFQFVLKLLREKNENKQKRGRDWPIFKEGSLACPIGLGARVSTVKSANECLHINLLTVYSGLRG